MSLDFRLNKINNWQAICRVPTGEVEGETILNPITQALIWLGIPCGFCEITAKNAEDVFKRIHLYEKTFGAFNRKLVDNKPVDCPIEFAQVLEHIGLEMNTTKLTLMEFQKAMGARLWQDCNRQALVEIEETREKANG